MKKINLILIVILLFSISSCVTTRRVKTTKTGIKYKFVEKNKKAKQPQIDDFIFLDIDYLINDSLLFESKVLNSDLKINFIAPIYEGDVNEGLALMHEGDSLIFWVDAKNFYDKNMGSVPDFIKEADKIEFRVRMNKVLSPEEDKNQSDNKNKTLKEEEDSKLQAYLSENKITTKPTESGLYFIETEQGRGVRATKGKTVVVHYTGYFLDGTKFDSSKDRNQPFEFELGAGRVIKGWDEGIAMMDVGDKVTLIIPSKLAYGERGAGKSIPPFSTIIFDVELLKIK